VSKAATIQNQIVASTLFTLLFTKAPDIFASTG